MKKVVGAVLLTIINPLTTVATLMFYFGLLGFASMDGGIESQARPMLIVIFVCLIMIEILKWFGYFKLSFRYKNIWLIFYSLYTILLIIIGITIQLFSILVIATLYIVALSLLFMANRIETTSHIKKISKEKQFLKKDPYMDRIQLIGMSFLFIPILYLTIDWHYMLMDIILTPNLLTFHVFMINFSYITLIIVFGVYSLIKLWKDMDSNWIYFFLGLFFIQLLLVILTLFFPLFLYNTLGVMFVTSKISLVIQTLTTVCSVIGYIIITMASHHQKSI